MTKIKVKYFLKNPIYIDGFNYSKVIGKVKHVELTEDKEDIKRCLVKEYGWDEYRWVKNVNCSLYGDGRLVAVSKTYKTKICK